MKSRRIVDRSNFPNAHKDYTPAQRRAIDRRLAQSEKEYREGRSFGPFNSVDEMIASMKAQLKKRAIAKKSSHSR